MQNDPALAVCKFLQEYTPIWDRHFPNCTRRGHWQIAHVLRGNGDGLLFSAIRGKMSGGFGMDEETCVARVKELIGDQLIATDEPDVRASTFLTATPKLTTSFDAHVVDAAGLMWKTARDIDPKLPRFRRPIAGEPASKRFIKFFGEFIEGWDEYRAKFVKAVFPKSPARQAEALLRLKNFGYWHILLRAWEHEHECRAGGGRRDYLLVDDFHIEIFKYTGVGIKATAGYVQHMIDWGFLRRLNREDGVKRGKFAVRMDPAAFATFRDALIAGGAPIVEASWDFSRMFAESQAGGQAKVITLGAS